MLGENKISRDTIVLSFLFLINLLSKKFFLKDVIGTVKASATDGATNKVPRDRKPQWVVALDRFAAGEFAMRV